MRQSDSASLKIGGADAMRALGRKLGAALVESPAPAIVVTIQGDLGAGKTTFVSGVLNGAGIKGFARSPTYTLIEPYEIASRHIFHLDLYRLADPREVEPLGLRDLLSDHSALLIEWPERGGDLIPAADLALSIDYAGEHERLLTASSRSEAGRDLLNRLIEVQ